MNTKGFIWLGMFVGSTLAGFVPGLWGASFFSLAGLVFSSIGALAGIWVGYKVGNAL